MITICLTVIDSEQDRSRFLKIYENHKDLMHFVARRVLGDDQLAEDAVQEAFINVAKNFDRIKSLDENHLKNLLAVLARNESISLLRKEGRYKYNESIEADDSLNEIPADDDTFSEVHYLLLKEAILKLPDNYRNLLYLVGVCELDIKDAAGMIHISYETAKKRIQRSRKLMEKIIGGNYDDK